VTFLAIDDVISAGGTDLRLGGKNEVLQWHRGADDATLPEQDPTGTELSEPLPADRWTCVQFTFQPGSVVTSTWPRPPAYARPHEGSPGAVQDQLPCPLRISQRDTVP
jgi:hypothetical protein